MAKKKPKKKAKRIKCKRCGELTLRVVQSMVICTNCDWRGHVMDFL